ncbi:hypothetical protein ABZ924_16390 [Streptomyces sp. NPDC046876]|uniref:hypothetical protein n=1 Tax=Streptomyces sp. NPDC046876 TaxID=3155616 RepID=UPI0033ED8C83
MPLKPSRFRTAARLAVPAAAALTLTMALASPASASPAFVAIINGRLTFTALPGEVNTVTFDDFSAGTLRVTDTTSNLTAGPGCVGSGHTVICAGPTDGVTRIVANLGDRNDTATNDTATLPGDMNGGPGQDILVGGNGNDRLTDPDGWGSTPGETTFVGRGGNDTIVSRNGGFDKISCGPGFDLVVADSATLDTLVAGAQCEFVQR